MPINMITTHLEFDSLEDYLESLFSLKEHMNHYSKRNIDTSVGIEEDIENKTIVVKTCKLNECKN